MRYRSPLSIVFLALLLTVPSVSAEGHKYAFLVGVANYDRTQLDPLEFTTNDILEFKDALLDSGFGEENVVVLVERQEPRFLPEAKKIRAELDLLLSGLNDEDSVVVALAGHGVEFHGEKKSYFCPLDADLKDKNTLLSLEDLYQLLAGCQARRKLLLVDACRNDPQRSLTRSGRATVRLESVTRPQTEAVPEGIVALFSCGAGQQSFEDPEIKHGVFFYHVLQGWRGQADENQDGKLTFDELTGYTRLKTQSYARLKLRQLQTPYLRSDFQGVWTLRELDAKDEIAAGKPSTRKRMDVSGKPTKTFTNSIGMELVLIPAGEFQMGQAKSVAEMTRSFPGTSDADFENEFPVHTIKLSKDYYVGKHEVTVAQFREFVTATQYRTDAEEDGRGGYGIDDGRNLRQKPEFTWLNWGSDQSDDHPVVNLSYNDAVRFCEWLSKKEQVEYRLPTEAEWEYACRAGTTTNYCNGDTEKDLIRIANLSGGEDGYSATAPVGRYPPNTFGLHDMHGNALEWCRDWYGAYSGAPTQDPTGPSAGHARVLRGGGWTDGTQAVRSSNRFSTTPRNRAGDTGFRVVTIP